MSVFPYIQICSDLLQKKYHFGKVKAGYLFGIPYIISACASPFIGYGIDKFGRRAFLICMSSVILTMGFASSMMMPECNQCYNEVLPLILTGVLAIPSMRQQYGVQFHTLLRSTLSEQLSDSQLPSKILDWSSLQPLLVQSRIRLDILITDTTGATLSS